MEIDVGHDAVGVPRETEFEVAASAARLGYTRIWTGSLGDPFQVCALRWAAANAASPGGIGAAIGVLPVGPRSPADLAGSAAMLSELTAGRFVLGLGVGSAYRVDYRRTWGIGESSPLALARAYITTTRALLAGDVVTFTGSGIDYHHARLPTRPIPTPVFVGAVGPEMVRLGGELADGVYLSWCTPDQVTESRTRMAEGAARSGRDSRDVTLAASVRVSVDEDPDLARRALAESLLPYVYGWDATPPAPFRAGFERMGFAAELAQLDRLKAQGLTRTDLIEAFPDRMLQGLGYFGRPEGAADAVRLFAAGADIAVVRLVPARSGVESLRAILDACAPDGG
jgi:alkanesulfonate monooxygenase SsuD/methylene tetrahydromethanopterin reductase-like flavin-dependent oxidoreductase (luciferase family)